MERVNMLFLVNYLILTIWSEKFSESWAQVYYKKSHEISKREYEDGFYEDHYKHRSSTDLPVSFRAPSLISKNYWNYASEKNFNTRTSLTIFPTVNNFSNFMSPEADRKGLSTPSQSNFEKIDSKPSALKSSYKFYSSTRSNLLPPPKPLRASIVKLETITETAITITELHEPRLHYTISRSYPKFPKFFQFNAKNLVNLHIDELGFHSNTTNFSHKTNSGTKKIQSDVNFFIKNRIPIGSATVSNITSTITDTKVSELHPLLERSPNQSNIQSNSTGMNQFENKRNGNNVHKNVSDNNGLPSADSFEISQNYVFIKNLNRESTRNTSLEAVDQDETQSFTNHNTTLNSRIAEGTTYNHNPSENNIQEVTFVGNSQPVKNKNSIKNLTDLTLKGLLKNHGQTTNIPRYTNYLNISNLIDYEINKIQKNFPNSGLTSRIMNNLPESLNCSSKTVTFTNIHENDELNLDLKILRDTNWDGFTRKSGYSLHEAQGETIETTRNLSMQNRYQVADEEGTNKFLSHDNQQGNIKEIDLFKNKKIPSNGTFIVETRITKSITKKLHPQRSDLKNVKFLRSQNSTKNKVISEFKMETLKMNAVKKATDQNATHIKEGNMKSPNLKRLDFMVNTVGHDRKIEKTAKNNELLNSKKNNEIKKSGHVRVRSRKRNRQNRLMNTMTYGDANKSELFPFTISEKKTS